MISFDLRCAGNGHVFEAWFRSSGDYEEQRARGLIACPYCGDATIGKAVMAPNVATKGDRGAMLPVASADHAPAGAEMKAILARMATLQARMLEKSEWVGPNFARRARAAHFGETEKQAIHGEATPIEAAALIDEGIAIAPLPFPVVPPEQQN